MKTGTKVIHVNHGSGVILHVYPDTDCLVQFDHEIWQGDGGRVIVSQSCLTLVSQE